MGFEQIEYQLQNYRNTVNTINTMVYRVKGIIYQRWNIPYTFNEKTGEPSPAPYYVKGEDFKEMEKESKKIFKIIKKNLRNPVDVDIYEGQFVITLLDRNDPEFKQELYRY